MTRPAYNNQPVYIEQRNPTVRQVATITSLALTITCLVISILSGSQTGLFLHTNSSALISYISGAFATIFGLSLISFMISSCRNRHRAPTYVGNNQNHHQISAPVRLALSPAAAPTPLAPAPAPVPRAAAAPIYSPPAPAAPAVAKRAADAPRDNRSYPFPDMSALDDDPRGSDVAGGTAADRQWLMGLSRTNVNNDVRPEGILIPASDAGFKARIEPLLFNRTKAGRKIIEAPFFHHANTTAAIQGIIESGPISIFSNPTCYAGNAVYLASSARSKESPAYGGRISPHAQAYGEAYFAYDLSTIRPDQVLYLQDAASSFVNNNRLPYFRGRRTVDDRETRKFMSDIQLRALAKGILLIAYGYAGIDGYALALLQPTRANLVAVHIPIGVMGGVALPKLNLGDPDRYTVDTYLQADCDYMNAVNRRRQDRTDHITLTPDMFV